MTSPEADRALRTFREAAERIIEDGTEAERVYLMGMLAFKVMIQLKKPAHQIDLMNSLMRFAMLAGGLMHIGTVKEITEKHNKANEPAKLAAIFLTVASQHIEIFQEASRHLENLIEVLDAPEHFR